MNIAWLLLILSVAVEGRRPSGIFGFRGGGGGRKNVGGGVKATGEGPLQVFARTIKDSRRHLAAAAAARSTSIFAMYPVDTIKVSQEPIGGIVALKNLNSHHPSYVRFRRLACKWSRPIHCA